MGPFLPNEHNIIRRPSSDRGLPLKNEMSEHNMTIGRMSEQGGKDDEDKRLHGN